MVRERLGDQPRADFALRLGVAEKTLGNHERGDRVPDADVLAAYREQLGVDLTWLVTGEGDMFAGPRPSTALERQTDVADHLVMIPQFELRAAAGPGLVPAETSVSNYFTVEREWLRRFLPSWAGTNAAIGILQGQGDSMEPTIFDGDMIMVAGDPPWEAVRRGGIFVVLHHDELRIKRLQHYPKTGDIDLISDNSRYAVEKVPRGRVEFDLRILGQVFFAGGRLRG